MEVNKQNKQKIIKYVRKDVLLLNNSIIRQTTQVNSANRTYTVNMHL